jgi:hypothetical protein
MVGMNAKFQPQLAGMTLSGQTHQMVTGLAPQD